jgi:hypothetical protein
MHEKKWVIARQANDRSAKEKERCIMTCQIMKHEEAITSLAVERYLLGEMGDDERSAFEAHYLNCAECLEAVAFADEFMEQARPVARHLQAREATNMAPAQEAGFISRLLAGLKSPAPAWALVLVLAAITTYQTVHRPKGAFPVSRYVLTGIAHGAGDAKVMRVSPDTMLSLGVPYGRSGEFLSYRTRILSESGAVRADVAMPGDETGDTAWVAVLARTLDPGRYSVVVEGKMMDGTEKEIGRGAFELQFNDK